MDAWTLPFMRKVLAAAVAGKVTLPTPEWTLLCKPESSSMSQPAPIVRIAQVLDTYFATAGPQAVPDRVSLDLLVAREGQTLSEDVAEVLYQEWVAIRDLDVSDVAFVQEEIAARLKRQRLMQVLVKAVDRDRALRRRRRRRARVRAVRAGAGGAPLARANGSRRAVVGAALEHPGRSDRLAAGEAASREGSPPFCSATRMLARASCRSMWPPASLGATRGPWAAATRRWGNVLLLTAEDGLADTVRPRIDALGGDPDRIFVLESIRGQDRPFSLDRDIPVLQRECRIRQPVLIVIDPICAYFGGKGNSLERHRCPPRLGAAQASLPKRRSAAVLGSCT